MPACHATTGATPWRIDGIVCNLDAAVLIHFFKVEKDEMLPTRSIVKLIVSRNAMKQKKELCKKLAIVEEGLRSNN